MDSETPKPSNYWDYIDVESLLSLQRGNADDEGELSNDEVMFIVVHQIYELWFKLMLREMTSARDLFTQEHVEEQALSNVVKSLKRISTILSLCNEHWRVMETLTTREFLAFRSKLMGASGGQSAQLRQLEILFGLAEEERIRMGFEGSYLDRLKAADGSHSPALDRVRRQLEDVPTLKQAIHSWLFRTPIDGVGPGDADAEEHLRGFVDRFLAAHRKAGDDNRRRSFAAMFPDAKDDERARLDQLYEKEQESVRAFLNPTEEEGGAHRQRIRCAMLFIETYRELPLLAWPREVLDSLVEVEQRFVIFRQRHARMVERMIGRRAGTGGSAGVAYLDETAMQYRVFNDLWAIRTLQLERAAAPALERADYYGFASDG